MKYVFVTGGVVSSLGKGIATSSLGALLRARGYRVVALKIDPYINLDAGTMRPYEHGEVFVTGDGAETDLDIGNYERFLDVDLRRENNLTTGQVYLSVIQRERRGEYLSQTVQVIPHITDEIKARIRAVANVEDAEICVVEVGGTVGDIESLPFLEAIRTMRFDEGRDNTLYLHLTLAPQLGSGEVKTKPTQHSVATLRSVGINPDLIMVRTKTPLAEDVARKIAMFTNVEPRDVFSSHDVEHIYEVPLALEAQGFGRAIEKRLGLEKVQPNLVFWQDAVRRLKQPRDEVTIAIAGKYVAMPDAYLSLLEALRHAGIANDARVNFRWVNAEDIEDDAGADRLLAGVDGILVPGGFGIRGIEGKVRAACYSRQKRVPYLGICLGMQIAVIEYARHVAGLGGANSTEFDPYSPHPVIDLMPEQLEVEGMGGTMRLGDWLMEVQPGTLLEQVYGPGTHRERHRHRYEVNPAYVDALRNAGLVISGVTPGMQGRGAGLVEAVELRDHPFYLALQSHPEFLSRPMRASPPFRAFIEASLEHGRRRPCSREASMKAR
ncbi:MAG TPA: CTP synthase, partial [Deinococcales bacterium]|nr:CTP synthase [Deinococcales bacterium]